MICTGCLACRYSPSLALLGDGRLHAFGGLLPDRATPAREHWSLAVNAGAALQIRQCGFALSQQRCASE